MTISAEFLEKHLPGLLQSNCRLIVRAAKEVFEACPYFPRPKAWRIVRHALDRGYCATAKDKQELRIRFPLPYWNADAEQVDRYYALGVVKLTTKTVRYYDIELLNAILATTEEALTTLARPDGVSQIGMGLIEELVTAGVSGFFQQAYKLDCDLFAIIRYLIEISSQTYENQRVSYGIVFVDGGSEIARFPRDIERNKRILRLSDGVTTAIGVNRRGFIEGLVSLVETPRREPKGEARFRPRWLTPLAIEAANNDSFGIALTRNGDLHLVDNRGVYIAARRHARWMVWNHKENIELLCTEADAITPDERDLVETLYNVALDLSSRRSGGLLVLLNRQTSGLSKLVPSVDRVFERQGQPGEAALDEFLSRRRVGAKHDLLERSVLVDLASLDGAVVIDRSGHVEAYGAVLLSRKGDKAPGARTRAAITASTYGIALKISSDGDISVFKGGQPEPVLSL